MEACSSHTCAGELCSCSLSLSADFTVQHLLEDDEFFSQFEAPLLHKRPNIDNSVRNGTTKASKLGDVDEQPAEGDTQQSFRESFYSSGTDWSCLYSVDDYGMPCDSYAVAASDPYQKPAGERNTNSIGEGLKSHLEAGPTLDKSRYELPDGSLEHGKLVQSTLSSLWGFKSSNRGNPFEEKAVTRSNFWSKFKHPPTSSDVAKTLPAVRNSSLYGGNRPRQGPFSTGRGCPWYKKIPNTSFTVDAFRYGEIQGCKAYFLTHFHADHYGGLTKSWAHGPIYCTPVTAKLLSICLYVDERWIHPVPIGSSHIIDGVEVKMLDANHCPGAAIILFRLRNGQTILHTGDFRACKAMQSYPELRGCSIHALYLDTTYCNERYRFPLQKEVIDFVIQVTQTALKKNSRTLVVVGAYSIGKERVYFGIAEALNVPIFTEGRRRRILKALEWPELVSRLSTDASSTLLHVLPIGYLRPQTLKAYLKDFSEFTSVLAFRPTGWTYSEKVGNELHLLKPLVSGSVTVYGVPYSEHSSFTELQEFVQFLQPEKIIPTVNVGNPKERDRMQSYIHRWLQKLPK